MQQTQPDQNQNTNPQNQAPQTPQANPSNQTFINTTPPNVTTQTTVRPAPQNSPLKSDGIEKLIQLVWFVVGFINVILVLRIIFLLFDAQSSGFRGFLYSVTLPFVMPFMGIFPNRSESVAYFDTAAIVAIIIYSLAAWGIVTLIKIVSSKQPTE